MGESEMYRGRGQLFARRNDVMLGLGLLLVALGNGGCEAPGARIRQPLCTEISEEDRWAGLRFHCAIDTWGYINQQIVFRVRLRASDSNPVGSSDRAYADAQGRVAATRTYMLPRSPWTIPDARVSIPAKQLELHPSDLPALAEFEVTLPNGEVLARQFVATPVDEWKLASIRPRPRRFVIASSRPGSHAAAPASSPAVDESTGYTRLLEPFRLEPLRLYRELLNKWVPCELAQLANGPVDSVGGRQDGQREEIVSASQPTAHASDTADRTADAEPTPMHAESETEAGVRWYEVVEGDTLWRIAVEQLGEGRRWSEILRLNADMIGSPSRLQVGMRLRLPDENPVSNGAP